MIRAEHRARHVRDAVLARFADMAPTLYRDLYLEAAPRRGRERVYVLAKLHDLAPDYYARFTREAEAEWDQAHPIKETA